MFLHQSWIQKPFCSPFCNLSLSCTNSPWPNIKGIWFVSCWTVYQEEVFQLVGIPLVKSALAGYNTSILSYGQVNDSCSTCSKFNLFIKLKIYYLVYVCIHFEWISRILIRLEVERRTQCGVHRVQWLTIPHPIVSRVSFLASSKCYSQKFKEYVLLSNVIKLILVMWCPSFYFSTVIYPM